MRIAVIGGGLQGCGVALELAFRGLRVDLFERGPRLLRDASRHSEGKIHLGYVHAADDTMRTARLMATGAAAFLPTLDRWLAGDWRDLVFSTTFRRRAGRARCVPTLRTTSVVLDRLTIARPGRGFFLHVGSDRTRGRTIHPGVLRRYPNRLRALEPGESASASGFERPIHPWVSAKIEHCRRDLQAIELLATPGDPAVVLGFFGFRWPADRRSTTSAQVRRTSESICQSAEIIVVRRQFASTPLSRTHRSMRR